MTTVEQIRAEIEQFKSTVITGVDQFVEAGHITSGDGDTFLASVGIERPESAEVRAAREELAALKASVRDAVVARTDGYQRETALRTLGLTA